MVKPNQGAAQRPAPALGAVWWGLAALASLARPRVASDAWIAHLGSSHLDSVAGRHGDLPCHHRNNDRSWNARYGLPLSSENYKVQSLAVLKPETPHPEASMPLKATGSLKNRGLASPHFLGEAPRHRQRRGCEGVSSGRNKKRSSASSTRTCAPFATAQKTLTRSFFAGLLTTARY